MRRWLRILLVLAVVLAGTVVACNLPTSPERAPDENVVVAPSGLIAEIIQRTNEERRTAGLQGLAANNLLMQAAEIQVAQIATAGRLEHTLPEARYPSLADRVNSTGYNWQTIGENLATGQRDAAQAMASWMGSPGHRANILNASFTEIGVAYVVDPSGRPWYVQVFGRPR
jgi:uncharacterized protein YkwD